MFATGETVVLAEWIIDDTCLVLLFLLATSYVEVDSINLYNLPSIRVSNLIVMVWKTRR